MPPTWSTEDLVLPDGQHVQAVCPLVVSASRATDIPAFYAEWFRERLAAGYLRRTNPFNASQVQYVSLRHARVIVFWSKNPQPLIRHLPAIDAAGINYYFQFTLNDYEEEGLEPHVPPLPQRIATFRELSTLVGKKRVVWRFDPLILAAELDLDSLIDRVARVGDALHGFTEQLVISFADISGYARVEQNLRREGVAHEEFSRELMRTAAARLQALNSRWGYRISTCAESIDLAAGFGIEPNRCIDDRLMVELFSSDAALMEFLGYEPGLFPSPGPTYRKDKGQRPACGCIPSKDIGMYDTCPHLCLYCYANTSPRAVANNIRKHSVGGESLA
jgi:DNA repair photolyase